METNSLQKSNRLVKLKDYRLLKFTVWFAKYKIRNIMKFYFIYSLVEKVM